MKQSFLVTLFIGACLACTGPGEKPPTAQAETVPTGLEAYCFYEQDDKQFWGPVAPDTINAWRAAKVEQVQNGTVSGNLFAQGGPGPNGSEWNPATHLHVLVFVPEPQQGIAPELRWNDTLLPDSILMHKTLQSEGSTFHWFELERTWWEDLMRPIDSADYLPLYGAERMQALNQGEWEPIGPLNTGEVLEVSVHLGESHRTYFFHAAYGE